MDIEEKLGKLPASPGVYLMKGKKGEVLYIGKAKSLRSRVRSYFRKSGDTRYSVRFLAARVADIDWIVTASEKEALFLEDTLLKQHKPKYNIRLKDSKTYVSIKVTVKDRFPRILATRLVKKDGSRYFGPYVSSREVRELVKLIRRIFPLCVCTESVFRNRVRPCLDYQLGICSAPAVGLISEENYRRLVDGAIMLLEGRDAELVRLLKGRMDAAAQRLDFEEAAKVRDQIDAVNEMLEKQLVVLHGRADRDVFAFARADDTLSMQVLFIRDGRLVNNASYFFPDAGLPDDEALSCFVTEFYRGDRYVPDEVIMPIKVEDIPLVQEWLTEKSGKKVSLTVPARGDKLKLIDMARTNALEAVRKRSVESEARASTAEELRKRLRLHKAPRTIEAFDISNIGSSHAVGAMAAFRDALPDKSGYRLYGIRSAQGPDDYAMMYEVLYRRYSRTDEAAGGVPPPDLILIDGGKGQLNIALGVLKELSVTGVDVAALAKEAPAGADTSVMVKAGKKGERVFLPNVKDPVLLKEGSRPDLLLRRIRDEVHRFAVSYLWKKKKKDEFTTPLDGIPGVGAKIKKGLLERFGSIEELKNATVDELLKVPGVTGKLAATITEALRNT